MEPLAGPPPLLLGVHVNPESCQSGMATVAIVGLN